MGEGGTSAGAGAGEAAGGSKRLTERSSMYISNIDGLINNVSNDLSACSGIGMDDCIKGKHMRMSDSYPSLLEGTERATSDTGSSESGQENEGTSGDESSGEEAEVEADEECVVRDGLE